MGNLVASYNQYWIHPQALSIEINTFGNPNYLQASVSANSIVIAYIPNIIGYSPDGNYRQWVLKAYNTHFTSDSAKYMHLRLDRSTQQSEARIVYSNERLDIYGEPFSVSDSEDNEGSYFYILLGILSETDGTTLREWTQEMATGSLDTSEQRNEDLDSEWREMFSLNSSTGTIDVLKHFTSLIINGALNAGSAVISGILQAATGVFNAIRIGGKDITGVRRSTDSPYPDDSETVISTTADVTKNIRSRALIRTADATTEESTVQHSLAVQGDLSASGSASVGGDAAITGDLNVATGDLDVTNGDVTIGDFQDVSGQITGAQITHDGFATFANIKALSFQIYELIYNRIRANGGRSAFTGASGVVTAVRVHNAAQHLYRLDLRTDEYKVNDKTEFAVGDIFYSYINHVQNHGYSTGGQCWMHVTEVVTEGSNNYLIAQMYGLPVSGQGYYTNAYTYSGETHHLPVPYNLLPEKDMTITHWGNVSNTDRQSTFFIDSNDQNIVQLMNVDEPQISIANYGSIVGRLPSDLAGFIEDAGNPINPNQPYFYARGLVVRDLIQMDYQGGIIKTENYRGEWSLTVAQSSHPYTNTPSAFDTVTHGDAIWKCEQTGTTAEPGTDGSWTLIQSAQSLTSYKLIPTPNAFSVRADGTVVPSRAISVTVTQVHRGGVSAIATQYELTQLGLRVEYSIGQDGERSVLDIGAADTFDLEDGDPIELENGQVVMLEGEELDTALILAQEGGRGYVYIWLVDVATGIDLDQSTVVFTRDGTAMFRSTVFCRYNPTTLAPTPTTPSGGDYLHPSQVTPSALWHDGVPSGTATLWMSSRLFTSDGEAPQESAWSTPAIVTDTDNVDIQFSSAGTYQPIALGSTVIDKNTVFPISYGGQTYSSYEVFMAAKGWVDASESPSDAIWMAVNMKSAGRWLGWVYTKIKGEDGTDGVDGQDGVNGRSIVRTEEVYALADTGIVITPSSSVSWQTTIPLWQSGKNLWNALRIVYDSGNPNIVDIENLGQGVSGVEEQYCVSDGLSVPDTGAVWSTSRPQSMTAGQSLWNREHITYLSQSSTTPDPRPTYTTPSLIGYVGTNGTSFQPMGRATDSSTAPSSHVTGDYWYDTSATVAVVKRWSGTAWVTVEVSVGDAFILNSNSHLVSWNGTNWVDLGEIQGPSGERGQSVFTSTVFKRSLTNPGAPSASAGSFDNPVPTGWSDGIPSGTLPVWSTHRIFTSDGASPAEPAWDTPVLVADTPDMDVQFSENMSYTLIEDGSGNEVTKDTTFPVSLGGHSYADYEAFMEAVGWVDSSAANEGAIWMAVNRRVMGAWTGWTYTKIKGEDGRGVASIQEVYVLATNGTTPSSSAPWQTAIPQWLSGKSLWNAMRITYTEGDPTYYDIHNIGEGVGSVEEQYTVVNGLAEPGSDAVWSTTKPTSLSPGQSLWNREHITYISQSATTPDPRPAYTDPSLIGYVGTNGTSFRPIARAIDSSTAPSSPSAGTYWFDTHVTPAIVKRWTGSAWTTVALEEGDAYTLDSNSHLMSWNGENWVDLGRLEGPQGQSVYNSVIFKRSAAQPSAPSAASGSFASPVPSGWSAGIPAGNLPLWTTHRTFTSDGNAPQDASWPVPTMVVDTPDLDVQFSLADTKVPIEADNGSEVTKDTAFPVIFGGHSYATYDAFMAAAGWMNEVSEGETVVWMAVNQRHDGQWLGWVYSRIKPEEANGIDIMQERYLLIPTDISDAYVYFLDHIDDSQDSAYYDADNPDYNLWNALYIAYTDGRDPILYDLENFGAGVKTVTEYYRLTETGETPAFGAGTISQWDTSKADVTDARTASDHYLWNAERIEYMAADKPVTYTSPALVGYYAVDGVSFNILDNIHSYAYITAQHIETYPGLTYFNFVNDTISVYQYGNDGDSHVIGSQGMAYRTLDAPLENHLIYHNGTKWIDLGSIVGPKGDPGDDGRPASKVRLTPELTSIPIDPDTRKTLADTSIQFTAQLFYGTEAVAIDSYTVAIQGTGPLIPPTGKAVTITKSRNGNTLNVQINIPKDTAVSAATVYTRVALLNVQYYITGEYADFAMLFVERGKTGPMGSAGPLLYPAGNYDEAVAALADNGYVNDGVTTPYVYFQASGATEGRYYYRTTNGYHYDQQGHLLNPATDYATNQSASAWMLIPQYDAIYTKILFANYANLGKAVFWGPYMFSEYGVRSDGQQVHWSAVEGIDGQQIFDPDTQQFTGDFTPNYYVNLSTGKMHCVNAEIEGVLTETFVAVEDQEDAPQVILMDADAAHNVSVEEHSMLKALLLPMRSAVSGIVTDSTPTPVVTAGMGGFDKQGVSVRVVNQYAFNLATADQNAEASLLLCADPRMFVPASYTNEATSHYTPVPTVADRDGFFIWNGVAAKFILIPAGYQVRLTMLDTYLPAQNRYVRHWYVDGGADFNAVAMTVNVYPRLNQLCEFGYVANAHRTPTADWLETFLYPSHFLPTTATAPHIDIDLYGSTGIMIEPKGFVNS